MGETAAPTNRGMARRPGGPSDIRSSFIDEGWLRAPVALGRGWDPKQRRGKVKRVRLGPGEADSGAGESPFPPSHRRHACGPHQGRHQPGPSVSAELHPSLLRSVDLMR